MLDGYVRHGSRAGYLIGVARKSFAKPSRAFALNRFRHGARGSGRRMIGAIHRALFSGASVSNEAEKLGTVCASGLSNHESR